MQIGSSHRFRGLEIAVRRLSGARGLRVVHPGGQVIRAHRHDWPLLTVPALGGYDEHTDDGLVSVSGPAAILHPPGQCHANCIHALGMETFSIEFDPSWLPLEGLARRLDRSHYWIGGRTALAARNLAAFWLSGTNEADLRSATGAFFAHALNARPVSRPAWLPIASRLLTAGASTGEIAAALEVHPAWLACAYRAAVGEGLHETQRRRRVEQAIDRLRSTDEPIAEIAAGSGFCDQSHLNRAIRRFTGRTPMQIRAEREALTAFGERGMPR